MSAQGWGVPLAKFPTRIKAHYFLRGRALSVCCKHDRPATVEDREKNPVTDCLTCITLSPGAKRAEQGTSWRKCSMCHEATEPDALTPISLGHRGSRLCKTCADTVRAALKEGK